MLEVFKAHIEAKFPEFLTASFLLACSGGIDSMVLTDLCARCGLNFAMAHGNFQMRGKDSHLDEKLVRETANRLHKKYYTTNFDTLGYVNEHKVSVQMAARELRYVWFDKLLKESGIKTLVTAHHADDNLETFLINLSRGTGIDGLTGIPEKTESIARPMLPFSREQIKAYAHEQNIEWREDSSNADIKYLRNNIRHQVLPLLKELNTNFLTNFKSTQKYLSQTATIAENHIRQLKAALFRQEGRLIKIPIGPLVDLEPLQGYLYKFFSEYGFTEWNDVENLLGAMSGKEVRSKSHRLVKDREFLLLTEIVKRTEKHTYQIQEGRTYIEKPIKLNIEKVDAISETGNRILYVAKTALKYPLTLRKWERGDYFCPLGMKGKKKLSKFFKDEKINVIAKENQWLLCSEGKIVWVIGKRADDRFKVSENTEEILRIELKI